MLKLTIPNVPDFYSALINHKRVTRVVALSGGYTRAAACQRLSANHGMIASFSRALAEDLRYSMSDAAFDAALAKAIDEITAPVRVRQPGAVSGLRDASQKASRRSFAFFRSAVSNPSVKRW